MTLGVTHVPHPVHVIKPRFQEGSQSEPFTRSLQPTPRAGDPLTSPCVPSSVYGAVRDPLEAKREVCELNPDCDELADHIGFQEAYRRFYGPV